MKKSLIILSILLIALLAFISISHANMFNRFKKGFYFEKYSTAQEAKAELLKLHPIGSDVDGLVKTLERAESKFINSVHRKDLLSNPAREKEYFSERISNISSVRYRYEYDTGAWLINPITWFILIYCDDNNLITDLHLSRDYMGL